MTVLSCILRIGYIYCEYDCQILSRDHDKAVIDIIRANADDFDEYNNNEIEEEDEMMTMKRTMRRSRLILVHKGSNYYMQGQ